MKLMCIQDCRPEYYDGIKDSKVVRSSIIQKGQIVESLWGPDDISVVWPIIAPKTYVGSEDFLFYKQSYFLPLDIFRNNKIDQIC